MSFEAGPKARRLVTLVVRLWPADLDQPGTAHPLRSDSLQTGDVTHFHDVEGVAAYIEALGEQLITPPASPDRRQRRHLE